MNTQPVSLKQFSDRELLQRTHELVGRERRTTVDLLVHLAELDARELYLAEGCSSLFTYCTRVLRFSEGGAYTRMTVARAGKRFPRVLEYLARGECHLAALRLLAPHLTMENHQELLARAKHKSKREVQELVAEIAPRPPVVSMVRSLPVQPRAAELARGVVAGDEAAGVGEVAGVNSSGFGEVAGVNPVAGVGKLQSLALTAPSATGSRSVVDPLAPDSYRVHFTADDATVALLRRAQDLLRHQSPNPDPAEVVKLALAELVARLEKQKAAQVDRPQESPASRGCSVRAESARNTRTIPATVRREVWKRDQGQCAFVGRGSRRCAETGWLEYHHVIPYARGGPATVDNIELRCRAHNQYEGRLEFGQSHSRFSASASSGAEQLVPGPVVLICPNRSRNYSRRNRE